MPLSTQRHDLVVGGLSQGHTQGWLRWGHRSNGHIITCALGRTGRTSRKREGDGATPIGRWPVREILLRTDRGAWSQNTHCLPCRPIQPKDGWCDAIGDRNYNRPISHPYPASAEHLWRTDHLYDVIVVLGYNDHPRIQGAGSAIFLHLANTLDDSDLQPTAGCIAVRPRDMQLILSMLRPTSHVIVT